MWSSNLTHAFDGVGQEFLSNLQSAAAGAVSSFLAAQLVSAIGINGIPGDLLATEAGQVINTILPNIQNGKQIFEGLSAASLANAAGALIGNKLAESIAD